MVDINLIDAAGAYGKLTGQGQLQKPSSGDGFQNALMDAISGTKDATENAEAVSMQKIVGQGDLIDVVTAVNNAEMVVESVVAVRDKVIAAYNDIIRMPM